MSREKFIDENTFGTRYKELNGWVKQELKHGKILKLFIQHPKNGLLLNIPLKNPNLKLSQKLCALINIPVVSRIYI